MRRPDNDLRRGADDPADGRSRPGRLLLWSTVALVVVTFAVPFVPGARFRGFTPLPMPVLLVRSGITGAYVLAAELAKRRFYPPAR